MLTLKNISLILLHISHTESYILKIDVKCVLIYFQHPKNFPSQSEVNKLKYLVVFLSVNSICR